MNAKRYRLSRSAEAELLELWVYLFEQTQSEAQAEKVVREIISKFADLAEFPRMGRSRDDIGHGYRSFPVGWHVIFYRLVADGIEISHVLHGAQDVASIYFPVPETEGEV
jgi:toxin ParE1/3/4